LGYLGAAQPLESLQFDNDGVIAEEIGSIGSVQPPTSVRNGELNLALAGDVPNTQLDGEGFLIDAFQEAAS